jgi:CxxC-x17-CxxC domain-containing protein
MLPMAFDRNSRSGGFGGGFSRGGGRGGFSRGRSSFGGGRSFGGDRGDRQMFNATCSNCGKECQVPFNPTNGKPVYCSDCFEKMGNSGDRNDSRRPERDNFRGPSFDQKTQFDALSVKLDKIISLLETKNTPIVTDLPKVEKTVKKAKATKIEDSDK